MQNKTLLWAVGAMIALRVVLAVVTPVFDTSEARYAAISANMARTGDFLVPRFTYRDRYVSFEGKPPLLFQLAGGACRLFGVREWCVRLPGVVGFLVVLALIAYCGKVVKGWACGLQAVGICVSSTALFALSGFCMPDALLVACVASAYLCQLMFLASGKRNWSLGVFLSLALGMVVKGPVSLALFGIGAALDAWANGRIIGILRGYRWGLGAALFLVIVLPWFVLMERAQPGFCRYFFLNENLLRFLVHDYGDRYGSGRETFRGMALVWMVVVTLPWTPLLYWTRSNGWRDGSISNLLRWGVVGMTGFWCLTSRVPVAYLIPVAPLAALWLAIECRKPWISRMLPWAMGATSLVLTLSLVAGMVWSGKMEGKQAPYRRNRYSYEFYHGTPAWIPRETEALPCRQ